ncbi:MAG: hypothetical protein PVJ64_14325, partial [Gemmatimonadales bacterium]
LTKDEILDIATWKAVRSSSRVAKNPDDRVRVVTESAFKVDDPAAAAHWLTSLAGVRVRMASAILTVYDPRRYTVLDVRAWASLERLGLDKVGLDEYLLFETPPLDDCITYRRYVAACRDLAEQLGVDLRMLDKCLWELNGRTPDEWEGG